MGNVRLPFDNWNENFYSLVQGIDTNAGLPSDFFIGSRGTVNSQNVMIISQNYYQMLSKSFPIIGTISEWATARTWSYTANQPHTA